MLAIGKYKLKKKQRKRKRKKGLGYNANHTRNLLREQIACNGFLYTQLKGANFIEYFWDNNKLVRQKNDQTALSHFIFIQTLVFTLLINKQGVHEFALSCIFCML